MTKSKPKLRPGDKRVVDEKGKVVSVLRPITHILADAGMISENLVETVEGASVLDGDSDTATQPDKWEDDTQPGLSPTRALLAAARSIENSIQWVGSGNASRWAPRNQKRRNVALAAVCAIGQLIDVAVGFTAHDDRCPCTACADVERMRTIQKGIAAKVAVIDRFALEK